MYKLFWRLLALKFHVLSYSQPWTLLHQSWWYFFFLMSKSFRTFQYFLSQAWISFFYAAVNFLVGIGLALILWRLFFFHHVLNQRIVETFLLEFWSCFNLTIALYTTCLDDAMPWASKDWMNLWTAFTWWFSSIWLYLPIFALKGGFLLRARELQESCTVSSRELQTFEPREQFFHQGSLEERLSHDQYGL